MKSWVPIPILIPVNEAQIPAIFPIPAKSGFPEFPGSRPNRDRGKIPNIFPIPAQSGSGKSRLFSRRPNRDGAGPGFGDFGVWPLVNWIANKPLMVLSVGPGPLLPDTG